MAKEPGFANVKEQLGKWWKDCHITRQKASIEKTAQRLYARKAHNYDPVEKAIGVPWYMVAVIDERESGARGGVLHNGEMIVGKNRKTRLVPAGRGPFSTWYESAIDALSMPGKNFDRVPRDKWSIELVLYCLEAYNGWGYRQYHPRTPSPYIWSCTNIYDNSPRGKYVADGKWGEGVTDQQIGCAPLLKALFELDKSKPKVEPKTAGVVVEATGAGAVVVASVVAATQAPMEYMPYIFAGAAVLGVLTWLTMRWYRRRSPV